MIRELTCFLPPDSDVIHYLRWVLLSADDWLSMLVRLRDLLIGLVLNRLATWLVESSAERTDLGEPAGDDLASMFTELARYKDDALPGKRDSA